MEFSLIQDLQEKIEHRLMRLLDLIEKHHAVGILTDLVHQQTTLLIAHVSRRRTIEQGYGVLLFELTHIETQQRRLIAKEESGQTLRQLCLTGTRRAKEEERAHRLSLFVQTRA